MADVEARPAAAQAQHARELDAAPGARLEALESVEQLLLDRVVGQAQRQLAEGRRGAQGDGAVAAALVETVAVLEGSRQTEVAFNTHLTRFDGSWRVEVDPTRREVLRGSLSASVDDVRDSLQESAEVLSETIERGALEFSEALREALEEIERDLHGQGNP